MDQETLEKHYIILREAYNDFLWSKVDTQKMKQPRTQESIIQEVESYVDEHPELHSIMSSGKRKIDWDDLKTTQSFDQEMGNVLINIESYIEEEYDL